MSCNPQEPQYDICGYEQWLLWTYQRPGFCYGRQGFKSQGGNVNPYEGIDLCSLAIELGATFVAQSFSGDKGQLIPILKAAMSHKGFALVNVISPCVTFNNNAGSTKSYDYVREHNESLGRVDFVPIGEEITTQYGDDEVKEVKLHDGSEVLFHKLRKDFDPENKIEVINAIQKARSANEILTGICISTTTEWS